MNALILAAFATLAVASASVVGHGGAVVAGPSGIVTNHGAIGPVGHGLGVVGLGHGLGWGNAGLGLGHGAILTAPVASAVVAGPALGLGLGHGLGLGWGVGHGIGAHGVAAITNGGGAISATGHGAAIQGPHTAPVVVAGPSGKIAADGLWGPTHNVGLGHHGW